MYCAQSVLRTLPFRLLFVTILTVVPTHSSFSQTNPPKQRTEYGRYVSSIRLAQKYVDEKQYDLAKSQLLSTPERFRNWEYGYLLKQCSLELVSLVGHSTGVQSAQFSPNGKRIVSASGDSVIIWDADSGQKIHALNRRISYAAFNRDGSRIVTFSESPGAKTAAIWDANMATIKASMTHPGPVNDVLRDADFSPDGNRVITTSLYAARVWDVATFDEITSIKSLARNPSDHEDMFNSATFDPSGSHIAIAAGSKAKVFDAENGKETMTLKGHASTVVDVTYSPDGKQIATASFDKTAKIWDAANGRELVTLTGHSDWIAGVRFSPDSQSVVTASSDHTARIWSTKTGRELKVLRGHSDGVHCASYSADGKRIVTASKDKTVKIWDAQFIGWHDHYVDPFSRPLVRPRFLHSVNPSFSPDGKYQVVKFSKEASAVIRDVKSGKTVLTLEGHRDVISGTFDAGGTRVVTYSHQPIAKVWDAGNGELLCTLNQRSRGSIFYADFSPDGSLIATASTDSTARIWNSQTGKELQVLKGHSWTVNGVSFSHDSERLVTASGDKTAKIWDVSSGKEMMTLRGHSSQVTKAIFSPDSSRVVTISSGDKMVKVWEAETGDELLSLKGDFSMFAPPAFARGGLDIIVLSNGSKRLEVFEALPWRDQQTNSTRF